MNEFDLIARYFTKPSRASGVLLGIGDDAAVLQVATDQRLVVAVDTIVEAVHFPVNTAAIDIGYRALAVNLSDIAAMGAKPQWMTLALSLPKSDPQWLAAFAAGLFELADAHDIALIGGDTVRGPLVVTIQIFGLVEIDRWLTRSGATPGDVIFISGVPGEAAAGLAVIQRNLDAVVSNASACDYLRQRFLRPTPRMELGRSLRVHASAALDVSDGLLADLGQLCKASQCGAHIDIEALPKSTAMRVIFSEAEREQFSLAGGDDYELLFTVPPERLLEVEAAIASGIRCTPIGRMTDGTAVICRRAGHPMNIEARGYVHFS